MHSLPIVVLHIFGAQHSSPKAVGLSLKIPSCFGHQCLVRIMNFPEVETTFSFRVAKRLPSFRSEVPILLGTKTPPEVFESSVNIFTSLLR